MLSIAHRIESAVKIIGKVSAWSMAILLVAIVTQVLLRYAMGVTSTMLEDSIWYLFSGTLMLGLSYTMTHDGHVRVDFLYHRYSPRFRKIVDVFGILLFLIPLYCFLMWHGWSYALKSYSINESSPNPGGMPWFWLIKGLLPLSCLLLIVESLARLIILFNEEQEDPPEIHGT